MQLSLQVKLASIAIHAQEALSPKGHEFDVITVNQLLADPEVMAFLDEMDKAALLPKKR